ncbi:MAG: phosphatidylglycerol lysyltransferase domain-containing protein [Treponema sp.]|jgi:hypothetical protein|nr:phosphatidylglycerol lysyltransferase domain-containing protein [Treponema sp.]
MIEAVRCHYDYFAAQGFRPVGREAFSLFEVFNHDSALIDLTPMLINTWGASMDALYRRIAGQFCVVWFSGGSPYHGGQPFYFTLVKERDAGDNLKTAVNTLYELARKAGQPSLLIESIDEAWVPEFLGIAGYHIESGYSEDHSEYAYRRSDFLDLAGTANKNKRERLGKVFKAGDLYLKPLTKENIHLILQIEDAWCRGKDCAVCGSYAGCERKALDIAADLYREDRYRGLLLYRGNEPAGYGIGEQMHSKTAFAYFAKGIQQDYFLYILYKMTECFFTGAEYINLGEDMGNPGIRMFKSHLGPFEHWRKHQCTYVSKKDT